jgi:hypothetical protein
MCKFLKFANFELNQKIWKTIQGQRDGFCAQPTSTALRGLLPHWAESGGGPRPCWIPALGQALAVRDMRSASAMQPQRRHCIGTTAVRDRGQAVLDDGPWHGGAA